MDLHGKVVVITGGNSGIGFATVQFLARKGAKVYMACRREEAYKDAVRQLENAGLGDGTVRWLHLDLSDPRHASSAAEELLKKEDRLDVLINNAARGAGPWTITKDGIRESMNTNYFSHFLFTEMLLPLMIKTSEEEGSDVRIVNLTSGIHASIAPETFKDKESWNIDYGNTTIGGVKFYALSKLANILHIKHLQDRLDSQQADITCISVNPAATATDNLSRWINSMPYLLGIVMRMISFFFASPREGAMNSAYAAASPEVKARVNEFKGAYLDPVGRITTPSSCARDERLARELYETSLDITAELTLND